ncbi:hypothetical protein EYV94_08595 [Puteibacter caeruleilacunae]|nr:hypothetical protein EYV94_08595 [Puteibacter caeruleilacunae]
MHINMTTNIFKLRNLLSVFFMMSIAVVGCDSIYDGEEFKVYEQEEPEGSGFEKVPEIGKKGICITTKGDTWSSRVSKTKAHWHYSWGLNLSFKEPMNIDFVPMFWGQWIKDENLTYLKEQKEAGKINFLLGFNEPDKVDQANMSVDKAIELWPKLEEVGVPLVSPAPANWNGDWLDSFMAKAKENDFRVDYIGIHLYYGLGTQKYLDICKQVYEKYGKPIWITEMAVADWGASIDENRYSREQVLVLMKDLLPKLEELPYVYRYAWFSGGYNADNVGTSALFDEDANLTPLGEFYANFMPNTYIGPGKDDAVDPNKPVVDPNDLIVNGHFEDGKLEPWGGFNNQLIEKGLITPYNGSFCGAIKNTDGSLLHFVSLEPGETYEVTFYAKWGEATDKEFKFAVKEQTGGKKKYFQQTIEANADSWTLNKATFTATTESKVRLIWYKGKGFPAFYIDAVTCLKK